MWSIIQNAQVDHFIHRKIENIILSQIASKSFKRKLKWYEFQRRWNKNNSYFLKFILPKCSYIFSNIVSHNINKIKRLIMYSLRFIKICFTKFAHLFSHKKNQQINSKLNNRSYIKTYIYRSKKTLLKRTNVPLKWLM